MSVTLWDAYFPALLIYAGDTARAAKSMKSWHSLWVKHRLIPMDYNFETDEITNPRYYLNPELIESAYYLWYFTKNKISTTSPVGKALLGKKKGDVIEIKVPAGIIKYEVLDLKLSI